MKSYEYILKFKKALDLSYANMNNLSFYPNEKNTSLINVAIDSFTFIEAVIEFERKYGEIAFTKVLDRDEGLAALFKYCISAYLEEDNFKDINVCNLDFYEWTLRSLEEIQEAIGNKEYVQCERCYSIVPKANTGILNGGLYTGKVLCRECLCKNNVLSCCFPLQ